MNRFIAKCVGTTLAVVAIAWSGAAFADAGTAIFVYGKVYVASADGDRQALKQGDSVAEGDTVITASNGRTQLQMADGGLLALRPGTEFKIEAFQLPADEALTLAEEPRSFFVLIKGGFRSITGAIGKENKANYRVNTPVATIGIRGTDYDAIYCSADCEAYSRALGKDVSDGLYVGVNSGGVVVRTDAGSIDLDAGDYGFAKDARSAPTVSDDARNMMSSQTSAAVNSAQPAAADSAQSSVSADVGVTSTNSAGEVNDLVVGDTEGFSGSGAIAVSRFGAAGDSVVSAQGSPLRNADGAVIGFSTATSDVALVGADPVNVGQDSDRPGATNLSWGRWATGTVSESAAATTSTNIDSSVHYVSAADGSVTPVLPTTGTADFDLVGNTDPTDNRGNVGTLGSASLSADFTAQTVDADVSLSIQETAEVWNASAQDVDINTADATFAGAFDSVEVSSGGAVEQGSGDLGGFFSGNDAGEVTGAGLTFSLEQGDTTVDGSAAFQRGD